jgi:hypothetical protein
LEIQQRTVRTPRNGTTEEAGKHLDFRVILPAFFITTASRENYTVINRIVKDKVGCRLPNSDEFVLDNPVYYWFCGYAGGGKI